MHDCVEVGVHVKVYFFSVNMFYSTSGELHRDICIVQFSHVFCIPQ